MPSRNFEIRVSTTAIMILPANPDRSSFTIINQHPALTLYVSSGNSHGPHVSTGGAHEGDMVGPNGGQYIDDDDLSAIWGICTAANTRVKVTETTSTGRLTRIEGARAK